MLLAKFLDKMDQKRYTVISSLKLKVSVNAMIIFPIAIVISVVLYIYYKVSILRTKDELTQVYFNSKSKICLGSFISFFGINQYIFYQTKLALFIGLIFVILGIMQIIRGFKEAKHYRKEWRKLNP